MSELHWIDEIAEFAPEDQARIIKRINGNIETREARPGVWEHTFTPDNGRQWYWQISTTGLTEDIPSESTTTSTQATDSMTADELLRIAEGIKDQRTQEWLEEYQRYSHASLLGEIEEMSKPTYDTTYMRYLAWQPQIVIPSSMPLPFLAEGKRQPSALLEIHRSIIRCQRAERRIMDARKASKRERRQHRAIFRRRKRGLA